MPPGRTRPRGRRRAACAGGRPGARPSRPRPATAGRAGAAACPRPEHGASTSTWSAQPGRSGGRAASATSVERRSVTPVRSALRATSRARREPMVAGHHGGPGGGQGRRLAPGGGAQVERPGRPARRRPPPPPAAMPGPARSRRAARSPRRGRSSPRARPGPASCPRSAVRAAEHPVGHAEPDGVARARPPASVATLRSTALTSPRTDLGAIATVSDTAAWAGTPAKATWYAPRRSTLRTRPVGRLGQEPVDEEVAGPAHAGGAVDQLGDEPPVAGVEARRAPARRAGPGWRTRPPGRCGRGRRAPPAGPTGRAAAAAHVPEPVAGLPVGAVGPARPPASACALGLDLQQVERPVAGWGRPRCRGPLVERGAPTA